MLELQVRQGELKRAIVSMGPSLRRLSCSDNQMVRDDVRRIAAQLARLALQDQNRSLS